MKTKDSKETVKTFSKMITKKNRPKNIWVDQGTECTGEFKKFCSPEEIENYSTMSGMKAASAEPTILSFKNYLYCLWVQVHLQITSIFCNNEF